VTDADQRCSIQPARWPSPRSTGELFDQRSTALAASSTASFVTGAALPVDGDTLAGSPLCTRPRS